MTTIMTTNVAKNQGAASKTSSNRMGNSVYQGVQLTAKIPLPPKKYVPDADKLNRQVAGINARLRYLSTSNPKTLLSIGYGYLTGILHLAPATEAGKDFKTCHRFAHCADGCLYHQGRGRMPNVVNARIRRTHELFVARDWTLRDIANDIRLIQETGRKLGLRPAIRLNGLSDLLWETPEFSLNGCSLFDMFPDVQFYDYTKWKYKTRPAWDGSINNYHLTYSFNGQESDIQNCLDVLSAGHNVNVVYSKDNYNKNLSLIKAGALHPWGYPMLDNEQHDLRFCDVSPSINIAKEKGYSKLAV